MKRILLLSILTVIAPLTFAAFKASEKILPLSSKFVKSLEAGPGCSQYINNNTLSTGIPDNLDAKYGSGQFINIGGKIHAFNYAQNGELISGPYKVKYKERKQLTFEVQGAETVGQLILFKNNKKIQVINNVHESCSG